MSNEIIQISKFIISPESYSIIILETYWYAWYDSDNFTFAAKTW